MKWVEELAVSSAGCEIELRAAMEKHGLKAGTIDDQIKRCKQFKLVPDSTQEQSSKQGASIKNTRIVAAASKKFSKFKPAPKSAIT
jgi:SOS response regulatory protein OraA/RecX